MNTSFLASYWYAPLWLWMLPVLALLGIGLWFWCHREFHRRLGLFMAMRLRTSLLNKGVLARKRRHMVITVAVLMALCVTLARPLGDSKATDTNRKGVNLLIALDGSRSMNAEDVDGSRMDLAQAGIDSLIDSFSGDRAGIMLFASQPIMAVPLTFDTVSLKLVNSSLGVEWAGKGGSSLEAVIQRAVEFFEGKNKDNYQSKALIIFTDGEETEGDAVMAANEAFTQHGIRIFTVGVGTEEGALIPRYQRNMQRELVKVGNVRDQQGEEVRSKLQAGLLQMVASVGGGEYLDLKETDGSLADFYQSALQPLALPMDSVTLQDLREWYQLPLLIALLLMLFNLYLRQREQPVQRPVEVVEDEKPETVSTDKTGFSKAAGLIIALPALIVASDARADKAEAERLMAAGQFDQAFTVLRETLMNEPEDPQAQYNYALGAYAAKKYDVAINAFEKLTKEDAASADADIATRSHWQMGNNFFRMGEERLNGSPQDSIILWEKALASYSKVLGMPEAMHNHTKVRTDLLGLLNDQSAEQEQKGDKAARLTAMDGVPAWQEAITYLDKAKKLADTEAQVASVETAHLRVSDKVFGAYFKRAEDRRRRSNFLNKSTTAALERAIAQMEEAVGDYQQALTIRPNDQPALDGQLAAINALEPWLIDLAGRQHEEGQQQREAFLEDAMQLWQESNANYRKVLQNNPESEPAKAGQEKNNLALHDGHVDLGDRKQQQAGEDFLKTEEKDALLDEALNHYESALALQPDNAATEEKLMQLGKKLTHRFISRGREEFTQGKALSEQEEPNIPEAIAWLERSIQSYARALRFEPENAEALSGKKEAEELLKKLRELDASERRRVLNEGKELNDAKEMEDPGDMALKLLDYDTEKLASKKQQDYIAPEDKSFKDW